MNPLDDDTINQVTGNHEAHPFAYPIIGAAVGGLIGHKLSKTRFGRWFENSPTIGWLYTLIILGICGFAIYAGITFIVALAHIMLAG